MVACLRAWTLLLALAACSFSAGCSEVSTMPVSDVDSQLHQQLGTVEKVSVLTTDGQEVFIDTKHFIKLISQEASLMNSDLQSVKQEDIKFTLIVYRAKAAPFVMEVGPGDEAVSRIYRWLRKETAEALFSQLHMRTLEVRASDLGQTYIPTEEESAKLWVLLQGAEFREPNDGVLYSLYPGYRIFLNTGERTMETRLLSPSMLAVSLGKEELYYTVPPTVFSQVTAWLPPQNNLKKSEFDTLFKSTRFEIESAESSTGKWIETAESSALQGGLHQLIRLLKEAAPAANGTPPTEKADWLIRLASESGESVIEVYGDAFRWNDRMYRQPELQQWLPILLKKAQKHAPSS